jgi:polyhydroxyalkanoic acid synthase PhaR subunit
VTDEKANVDPLALWKQWYEQNEKAWGRSVAEATGTEAFAEMQGKMLESFLAFQKTLRDASRQQLEALGLATRDDVARLGEIVLGLEEKVDQVIDRLDRSAPPAARAARAPSSARAAAKRSATRRR